MSDLYEVSLDLAYQDWSDPRPNYTMFATVSIGLIYYMVRRRLVKDSFQFGEFLRGRPEFYWIITNRTWQHLTYDSGALRDNLVVDGDVLFRCLFDMTHLAHLDRRSFLPWRPVMKKASGKEKYLWFGL